MKFTFAKRCPICNRAEGLHRIRRSFTARLLPFPVKMRNYYCPYCDKRFVLLGNSGQHKAVALPVKQA